MSRRARSPMLVVPLTALALTACAGEPAATSGASAGPSPTAGATATASAPVVSPVPSATVAASPSSVALGSGSQSSPAAAAQNAFEITFAEDQASGDTGRLVVGLGEAVTIRVTSLRADEVHLHGYDLAAPVRADRPAVLNFSADIPGVFALELEELGVELATLQVQ